MHAIDKATKFLNSVGHKAEVRGFDAAGYPWTEVDSFLLPWTQLQVFVALENMKQSVMGVLSPGMTELVGACKKLATDGKADVQAINYADSFVYEYVQLVDEVTPPPATREQGESNDRKIRFLALRMADFLELQTAQ